MNLSNLKYIGIGMLWLIHISAFIGIKLGYDNFFLPLSPYNLLYVSLLTLLFYPIKHKSQILMFLGISLIGFFAEVLGVATGQIFGEYAYGNNLGLKVFEVPLIIGINWGVLSFVCAGLAQHISLKNIYIKAIIGSLLMLTFDFFIEQSAPTFDFWAFKNSPVPIQNYLTWFILGFIFNLGVLKMNFKSDKQLCAHVYSVQFLFFMLFYVF
ncbi:carotenoid biosynthesis protein [Flavobacteriaceae bacterium 14752]|uniref:carotenoid biosynthesis protein n=1 Tax=Mesohalobacter salilacus TaxID=2491711 RepID=UPI000F644364|nr:carotenoid biosynthesis protein [Flavobacteriaceae bacterium 14752]